VGRIVDKLFSIAEPVAAVFGKVAVLFLCFVVFSTLWGKWNLDDVKNRSETRWLETGWEPVAYEGWQMGTGIPFTSYGGAKVWYRLRNIPDNGVTYSGYIKRWGDEYHTYGPFAIDAIRPH
jgi:hypothetical protein